MRFSTRTFLFSFIPFAIVLTGSFWAIQWLVSYTVRNEVRESLRQTHASVARVRSKSELQNSRFLKIIGENTTLKAGMQLLLAERRSGEARLTVEDQLREMCQLTGFDYLLASDNDGNPLAGILRVGDQLVAVDVKAMHQTQRGFVTVAGRAYQVASTPINQGEESLGALSVGEYFDFSEFSTPAVLAHDGKILKSSIPGIPLEEVEMALRTCKEQAECELKLRNETYISLPMDSIYFGEGYTLRSLQSVDSVSGPVQAILKKVFVLAGVGALLVAMLLSVVSSRSIVGPIDGFVSLLKKSEKTGLLPEFETKTAPIHEIQELRESFNRAAASIREGRESLHLAYVEFIGSLASALDARDRYTAGHSRRVSEFACAIAEAMKVNPEEIEQIRMGALLHDIGKIGIADSVLQKPGRLTDEERALIQQHSTIGRRILEGVHGFHPYLDTVELHHENWDGSGYPFGLRGTATPLGARIVHVADAYDAMTTDRPYRRGRSHEEAIAALWQHAGTQFDEAIVKVFTSLTGIAKIRQMSDTAMELQVRSLAESLGIIPEPVPVGSPATAEEKDS